MEDSMIEQPEDLYAEPGPDGDECRTCGAAAGQDCEPDCPIHLGIVTMLERRRQRRLVKATVCVMGAWLLVAAVIGVLVAVWHG